MSYDDYHKLFHEDCFARTVRSMNELEAKYLSQRTSDMLKGSKIALLEAIKDNLNRPKPHHKNKPLMTAVLKIEQRERENG